MKTWIFTNSTNDNMKKFFGVECCIMTPARKEDGHRVALIYKPDSDPLKDWLFYTSTIVSIQKTAYPEKGYVTLEIHTHNSEYYFYKKL